ALSWNTRCTTLWGLPPSAPADREVFLSGVHPEDRGRVDQFLRDPTGRPGGGAQELTFRTIGLGDGVERWVSGHVRVLHDDAGRPTRLLGAAFDVTEGKLLERELRFKKTLLESQSEAAIDGILVVDSA